MKNDTLSFLRWLVEGWPPEAVLEIRVLPRQGAPLTGFFRSPEKAAAAIRPWAHGRGQCYAGLNPRKPQCWERAPDRLDKGSVGGKTDDILAVTAVVLDFDPKRPRGAASDERELNLARERARAVDGWFSQMGFGAPLVNMSGNGWHLLARIPPQDPATFPEHLQAFLADVAGKFSDGQVDVDAVLFDAPRIIKIPGTVSVKGENTKERPWRRAAIARWTDPAPDAALAQHILAFAPDGVRRERDGGAVEPITGRRGALGQSGKKPGWMLRHVLDECLFIRHCREQAETLPEPLWYAMITNLVTFDDGEKAIHELSSPYPGYTRRETDAKIRHALDSAPGPHTCVTIEALGFRCPLLETCPAKAPAALAAAAAQSQAVAGLSGFERLQAESLLGLPRWVQSKLLNPPADPRRQVEEAVEMAAAMMEAGLSAKVAVAAFALHPFGEAAHPEQIRLWVERGMNNVKHRRQESGPAAAAAVGSHPPGHAHQP